MIAAPFVTRLLSSWSRFRNESELVLLMLIGGLVYGGLVVALFGRRWLSLMRRTATSAAVPGPAELETTSRPAANLNQT